MSGCNPADAAQRRARELLEGPVLPAVLRLAAPNFLLAALQAVVAFADTWFIGRLGTEPLAGLALVFPFMALMQMMSAGAVGGGVSSAIARACGRGDLERASRLAVQALYVAAVFGLLFTVVMLAFGPTLFGWLGGTARTLDEALAYAHVVFGGACCVWFANILANVVRGTGNMRVASAVLAVAAAMQIPVTALLVLGAGPVRGLGIVGAGIAYVACFGGAAVVLAAYLARGHAGLKLSLATAGPDAPLLGEILRVGSIASLNAIQTILTTLIVTGLVGGFGTAALAGYGVGARLELLQVPFVFAIGSALVTLVGMSVGAGDLERARRVAWVGGGLAALMSGAVGLFVALRPDLWAGMFSDDPAVLEAGYAYLRIAGPCYAFLGGGFALYFAAQGTGRIVWPVLAATGRLLVAGVGGWLAVRWFGAGLDVVFVLIGAGMAVFGLGAAAAVRWRVFR